MIPLFRPSFSELEKKYVLEVLESGWWGLGPKTEEFERKYAKFVGAKYAVALNSATAALDLALKVHDVHDGEVILPALTFVSTGLAALYNKNKVVFADINEKNLCIDWNDALKKTTNKTKAVIPVHYGGTFAGNAGINEAVTIEDCAHAVGNELAGKTTACWSFHAVKNLATGDGGMITTNDEAIYKKLLPMRWCGIDRSTWERSQKRYGWNYTINTVGYKCHMNDITAAIGLAQLERIDNLNYCRRMWVAHYLEELKDVSFLKLPAWDDKSAWHMFVVRIDAKLRNRFIDYMLAKGISVGVHYKPLNTYPMFPKTKLSVTDRVWKELVTLPLFPDMTGQEIQWIINSIKKFL